MAPGGRDAEQHSVPARTHRKKPQPAPVSDAEREQIRALHARGQSCNAIARELGRSPSTVTRQCQAMGLSFDRSALRQATAAVVADSAARRAQTSRRFLEKANEILDQMDGPFMAYNFGGRENTYEEHLFDRPPADALRTLMMTAAAAFDRHIAQDRHDKTGDQGAAAVDQWLLMMTGTGPVIPGQVTGGS
jgi:hypothetical protein